MRINNLNILVTGSNGFVGKNLLVHLKEKNFEVTTYLKDESLESLNAKIAKADFIFHLAGVNRPSHIDEFLTGNVDLTINICKAIKLSKKSIPIVLTSSIQAELDNPYGTSKKMAEDVLNEFTKNSGNPTYIYRLPNVFGKWCKPNYNSAVATFCHNIVNDLPVTINDPHSIIQLVYIDDVINSFMSLLSGGGFCEVTPVYKITVGDLEKQLLAFKESKVNLISEKVGTGLVRALYSTFVSYYGPNQFKYSLKKHEDSRGHFVEFLKTQDSGQFSFFTAHPGITRGGHYHHSKTEKFLVLKGEARFCFRHILSNEKFELVTNGTNPEVVETIPGWTHDITNIGNDEMIVMLWANEIFNREAPDTMSEKV